MIAPKPTSSLVWSYVVYAAMVVGFYAVVVFSGCGGRPAATDTLPPDVRTSPGGYRSFHFWHSGYQGGK